MHQPLEASQPLDLNADVSEQMLDHGVARLRSALLTLIHDAQQDDLTMRQFAVLSVLVSTPGPHTVRGLAAKLRIAKPVITRAVDRLESESLAKRHPDWADRRSVLIAATPRGSRLLNRIASCL